MNVNADGFLLPDEENLVHYMLKAHEKGFAWDESEKGQFSSEYFDDVVIPTIEHIPWALRNIPIPPGIYDRVIEIIKAKIESGIYQDSSSSYRSRWFCVLKKDGKSLRIVHDLQPLNAVTIKDAGLPPKVEEYAESFGGRGCYGMFDLFVGFDQRKLADISRDLTTFQTPLGTLRLTSIPMGYTNSMQIQHGDITYLLRDEIPEFTIPFVDDVPVKGPPYTLRAPRWRLRDHSRKPWHSTLRVGAPPQRQPNCSTHQARRRYILRPQVDLLRALCARCWPSLHVRRASGRRIPPSSYP